MTARIRPVHRNIPYLLPPDLRDWVPEDDMVHFVIEAVEAAPIRPDAFRVNERGTGSKQYAPKMMLALLIYSYANGIFSSRRIEKATYRDLCVRYLTADQHPDHDTICKFRRENEVLFAETFLHVLNTAKEIGVLKVGTVSVDGTHIGADASKSNNVRYDRAKKLEERLRADIDELIKKAEQADGDDPDDDGKTLPKEIARRERLLEKMKQAQADLERRARAKHEAALEEYDRKKANYAERQKGEHRGGHEPKEPKYTGPEAKDQSNLTDDDSRLMKKHRRAEYKQSYNAQIAVDADGSQLILSRHVTNCASDAGELGPALQGIDPSIGRPTRGLADNGYASGDAIERLENAGYDLYIPVTSEDGNNERRYDYRPPREPKKKTIRDKRLLAMKAKMEQDEAQRLYAKRKQTVEPVFGIIKSVLGFREFRLRGLEKVSVEWSLVTLAYNVKRLFALQTVATS